MGKMSLAAVAVRNQRNRKKQRDGTSGAAASSTNTTPRSSIADLHAREVSRNNNL